MSIADVLMQSPLPAIYMAVSFFALILPLVMGKDWRLYAPTLFRDEGCDEDRERGRWELQRMQVFAGFSVGYIVLITLMALTLGP